MLNDWSHLESNVVDVVSRSVCPLEDCTDIGDIGHSQILHMQKLCAK